VTGDDFRTTVAELSRIYLGYEVSYNSQKNTRGRKQIDSDINYELNEYLNQKYFLKLEKDYVHLQWEAEIKNLTYQKQKLGDLFKMGKIQPAEYYTKLELLYNTIDDKFAEIDEKYMTESYRIRHEISTLRKMKNEQSKNGFRARRRREISRGSKKENTLR
jgi:hypothetical protein